MGYYILSCKFDTKKVMIDMAERILLSSPHMSEEGFELEYIRDAFRKNWIAPLGENVTEFERSMAAYMETGYPVALSAGTAALHLAMILAGVKAGDKVFCQSLQAGAFRRHFRTLVAAVIVADAAVLSGGGKLSGRLRVHICAGLPAMDQHHRLPGTFCFVVKLPPGSQFKISHTLDLPRIFFMIPRRKPARQGMKNPATVCGGMVFLRSP